jgi:hypothetical protein
LEQAGCRRQHENRLSLTSILVFGVLLGVKHALDADHLAAVATLVARERSLAGVLRQGVAWGVGHTLALFVFGGAVLVLGAAIPEETEQSLELLVGAMLMLLGGDLLRRVLRNEAQVTAQRPSRALAIGMLHGLAGSAVLVLITVEKLASPLWGASYLLLFGLGSTLGMALLSALVSLPLRASAHRLAGLLCVLQGLTAAVSLMLGLFMVLEHM